MRNGGETIGIIGNGRVAAGIAQVLAEAGANALVFGGGPFRQQ